MTITDQTQQDLWHKYQTITEQIKKHFAMKQIKSPGDIYPAFRQLFERKENA